MKNFIKIVAAIMIFTLSIISPVIAFDNMPTGLVSVGVAPTEILPANTKARDVTIYNAGLTTVYIDNSSADCNTSTSFPLIGSASIDFSEYRGAIWGMVSITTTTIHTIYLQY